MQSYLAWSNARDRLGRTASTRPARDKLRAKLVTGLVTDALAPTNAVLTNPAAMKATLEQGGQNLVAGLQHFMPDMTDERRPAVDGRQVEVRGRREPRGSRPGKVVYAEDHLELIQYAPQTDEVWSRPDVHRAAADQQVLHLGPRARPLDRRAPGRAGPPGLPGQLAQPDARRRPTGTSRATSRRSTAPRRSPARSRGSPDLNVVGACSGGITAALLLALWGARGVERRRRAVALRGDPRRRRRARTPRWASSPTSRRWSSRGCSRARRACSRARTSSGPSPGCGPNDLIWSYWVNNYLMGNEPPAFDILYWNADTTNLPAALHADLLRLIETGGVTAEGGPTIGGHALKLEGHHLRHLPDGRRDRPHHALGRLLPDPRRARRRVRRSCSASPATSSR